MEMGCDVSCHSHRAWVCLTGADRWAHTQDTDSGIEGKERESPSIAQSHTRLSLGPVAMVIDAVTGHHPQRRAHLQCTQLWGHTGLLEE